MNEHEESPETRQKSSGEVAGLPEAMAENDAEAASPAKDEPTAGSESGNEAGAVLQSESTPESPGREVTPEGDK